MAGRVAGQVAAVVREPVYVGLTVTGTGAAVGLAAAAEGLVAACRTALLLMPGQPAVRQALVEAKVGLERAALHGDGDGVAYGVVRAIAQLLDDDTARVALLARGGLLDLPASDQDPVLHLSLRKKIAAKEVAAAREWRAVHEFLACDGIVGVKAIDPAAIRVDGGGRPVDGLATWTDVHPTARKLDAFLGRLAGRCLTGRAGKASHAELLRQVVFHRVACGSLEKRLGVRHGTVGAVVAGALREWVSEG